MRLKFKTIESVAQLVEWAKEINLADHITRQKNICDWQDVYARSKRLELDRLFCEAEGDRRLIICSVYNTMSFEEVEHLLSVLAKFKVNRELEKEADTLNKKYNDLHNKEQAFRDSMKPYHKKLADLRRQVQQLENKATYRAELIREQDETIRRQRRAFEEYKDKAAKYDQLKSLLA